MSIAPASSAGRAPIAATAIPRVSVVMTVYRDLRFLDEGVDSILAQTFTNFEFIIVDDGNRKPAVFDALARRDPRIRIVTLPDNVGAPAAANRGIDVARCDIIARLDADDVAEPEHIARLVAELDADPGLVLVGTAVTFIDENGAAIHVQPMPQADIEIRWTILFHNPFFHSTTAYRRAAFEAAGRYIAEQLISQDHYLWFHMLRVGRAKNLAEPLTRYRLNQSGLTATNAVKSRMRTHRIREALWKMLGLTYDLYDDPFADGLTRFLFGRELAPEARAAAYRKLLRVLRAFLASPRPFARAGDAAEGRNMARTLFARMLASPPPGRSDRLTVYALYARIDPGAAISVVATLVISRLWPRRASTLDRALGIEERSGGARRL